MKQFQTIFAQTCFDAMGLSEQQQHDINLPLEHPAIPEAFFDAVQLIKQAIIKQQKIFIGGDYDADGICATSIIMKILNQQQAQAGYYLPDRFVQGYGLHMDIAKAAVKKGYDCFILVDNGVASIDVNQYLKAQGKTILVIDHHSIQNPVVADGLIHPDILPSYFYSMCAAGLSAVLARAFGIDSEDIKQLAMVGTIADMMPVYRYNRLLIVEGLKSMQTNPMPQLLALSKTNQINEETIAFQVVPKLNAIGRLSDRANVNQMVQYFLLDQFLAIQSFATSLNELNNQRKQIGQEMLEVAQLQVSDDPFIYIADASFHQGVVGIVAGQLMRLTNRPTAIGVSFDNIIKASVRSNSVDIMSLYQPYTSLFTHFGGHAQAAGLEMPIDHWHILQHETNKTLKQQPINKQLDASTPIPLDIISLEGLEEFEHLAPFGQQFERPLLKLENCIVSATAHHPMGKVYKWRVSSGFIEFDVICFNQVPTQFYQASSITVVGTFKKEVYRNKSKFVFIANELL